MTISGNNSHSGFGRARGMYAFARNHTLALNVISSALVLVVAGSYIVQVNGSVAKGYAMREVEDRIKELTLTNQRLEVAVREAQSLQNVDRSVKMLGLVSSGTPVYLSSSTPSVAFAR